MNKLSIGLTNNFIYKITSNLINKKNPFNQVPNKNYYCEKWNNEQKSLKIKKETKELKLTDAESYISTQIKKNLEYNEKILKLMEKQNDDIDIIKKYLLNNMKYTKKI